MSGIPSVWNIWRLHIKKDSKARPISRINEKMFCWNDIFHKGWGKDVPLKIKKLGLNIIKKV